MATAELPVADRATLAVEFLRSLDRFEQSDEHIGVVVRRVQADVLELIIRQKRREARRAQR